MRRVITALTFLLALPGVASATILDDFNAGTIITDFTFDDPMGTTLPDVVNSGTLGGSFDSDGDSADVATDGGGLLDVSLKANTSFGSNYVDLPTIATGRMIALFDVAWQFDESDFDAGQDEEFRMTLVANDPRSTFVTAEIYFQRTSATEVTLFGNGVGSGGSDTPDVVLGSSGSLLTMLDLDIDSRVFELLYSADGGATFLSAGTGMTGDFDSGTPEIDIRPVSSMRLVLNEDFSADTMTVSRMAISIPEPSAALTVLVAAALGSLRRRD